AAHRLFRLGGTLAARGRGAAGLRANLRRAVQDAGEREQDDPCAAGMRSYARYWCDAFRLPAWDAERITSTVRTVGEEPVREALAAGRGVVGVLAHLGNWDHAGAWAQLRLAPVVTVAEELRPARVHELFLAYRRSLGMVVLGHADPTTPTALVRRLRAGAFVPLLADRDLGGGGPRVRLLGEPVTMPGGPAALALASGAALVPIAVHHEDLPATHPAVRRGARHGIVITFGAQVHPPAGATGREGRRRAVQEMTQACADALGAAITAHPDDWHVLQPLFGAPAGSAS
ncbi:phosphatidylinositol mannoside acyltransferase, partial [Kineococcus glutinatus]|uniref:phosphatidylinositol mannoside acyltransferase n=1 Tax=Kineococcus glutinatus TaxID=1070872 RepID=UPI0031EA618C